MADVLGSVLSAVFVYVRALLADVETILAVGCGNMNPALWESVRFADMLRFTAVASPME